MTCFHCGATLEKSDIFCIKCQTPVLTEDDAALVHFNKTVQDADLIQYSNTARVTSSLPQPFNSNYTESSRFSSSLPQPFNSSHTENRQFTNNVRITDEIKSPRDIKPHRDIKPPGDIEPHNNTEESDEEQSGYQGSRLKLILITVGVCLALVGVGFYFLIQPPATQGNRTDRVPAISSGGSSQSGTASGSASVGSSAVTSITLLEDGRIQSVFHVKINETIVLQARLEPDGANAEVNWSSGDPEILDIVQTGSGGLEARITGKAAGVVDIIVSAGAVEESYQISIDDFPVHIQLADAIEYTNTAIWLSLLWTTGPDADYESLLKRDPDSRKWVMEDLNGVIDIEPVFSIENKSFVIGIPNTGKSFYLFSDMTGHYQNPDGSESDDFSWWFSTTQIEAEG